MFEVDVKNVTKGREGKKGRRGPARVWGTDMKFIYVFLHSSSVQDQFHIYEMVNFSASVLSSCIY